jgi:signal transduction histidine kinase
MVMSVSLCAGFTAVTTAAAPEPLKAEAWFNAQQVASLIAIALYAAYVLETRARQNFELLASLNEEQRLTEQEGRERTGWLAFTTKFLRHELRNGLIGIGSSLMLLRRRAADSDERVLIDRADASVGHMRHLLEEAAQATELEESLRKMRCELLPLAPLVTEVAEEVSAAGPCRITRAFDNGPGIVTLVNEELLQEGLRRLLAFATRQHRTAPAVEITFEESADSVSIVIAFRQEQASVAPFDPRFATGPGDAAPRFDLFVAERIASAHLATLTLQPSPAPAANATLTLALQRPSAALETAFMNHHEPPLETQEAPPPAH